MPKHQWSPGEGKRNFNDCYLTSVVIDEKKADPKKEWMNGGQGIKEESIEKSSANQINDSMNGLDYTRSIIHRKQSPPNEEHVAFWNVSQSVSQSSQWVWIGGGIFYVDVLTAKKSACFPRVAA